MAKTFAEKKKYLAKIFNENDFKIDSNKKVNSMFKLVDSFSIADDLDIDPALENLDDKTNIKQTNTYLINKIKFHIIYG